METSEMIIFQRVLQQDNSFCLRFFAFMPISYSVEPQSNRRVQVVKTDQSEDNRSLVHR